MRKLLVVSIATALSVISAERAALAFPIAPPGTECLTVNVSGADPIIATYRGNSAVYSNDLYLMLDSSGQPGDDGNPSNDLFIFNNHTSSVGSTVNLGAFPVGTELIFRLHVNDTGDNFYTGPASRNPDGHCHARVQADWQPNETLVSFEDLSGGPFEFNDLSFSFTNTTTQCVPLCTPSCTPVPVCEINQPFANDFRVASSMSGDTIITELTDRSLGGNSHLYQATRPDHCSLFGPIAPVCGVNSDASDGQPWLSHDGLRLYFMSTRCSGGPYQCLFVAKRSDPSSCFDPPVQVPGLGNSGPCSLAGPTLTADELTIVFNRHCPAGNAEIWFATRPTPAAAFDPPQPLSGINLPGFDTADPSLSADGLTLYFSSNRPGGLGGLDVWVARRPNGSVPFLPPENVRCTNSSFDEFQPSITPDDHELYFSTNRDAPPTQTARANIWRLVLPTHTITAIAGPNGTIDPAGMVTVPDGGSKAFTIVPASHYRVGDVLVDGASVGAVTSYTFSNVTTDHTIVASFEVINRPPDCGRAMADPPELWSPEHQFVPVDITGVIDPDGDPVTITVTAVMQDEPLNGRGDGNTCPDATIDHGTVQLRAERSGNGDGRVYKISFVASDGRGGTCDGTVAVCVPHDQRAKEPDAHAPVRLNRPHLDPAEDSGCVGKGSVVNSLGPCSGLPKTVGPTKVVGLRPLAGSGSHMTLEYSLPNESDVELSVYDIVGRRVTILESTPQEQGRHQVTWNASGLSPGMYFYRLRAGQATVSRSVLILK